MFKIILNIKLYHHVSRNKRKDSDGKKATARARAQQAH